MDEIVNQFQQRYQQLRTMRDAGQLNPPQFIAEVQKLCWQDRSSVWWSINTDGVFLRFDGQKWMASTAATDYPQAACTGPCRVITTDTDTTKASDRQIWFFLPVSSFSHPGDCIVPGRRGGRVKVLEWEGQNELSKLR